jgi:hypothetical protein
MTGDAAATLSAAPPGAPVLFLGAFDLAELGYTDA